MVFQLGCCFLMVTGNNPTEVLCPNIWSGGWPSRTSLGLQLFGCYDLSQYLDKLTGGLATTIWDDPLPWLSHFPSIRFNLGNGRHGGLQW